MVNNHIRQLDAVFHALADPTRRGMLRQLAARDRTVSDLAGRYDMSLAAASKHIKVLEQAGLINRNIEGRRHICRLNPKKLSKATEWLRFYERFWNQKLASLEVLLAHDTE